MARINTGQCDDKNLIMEREIKPIEKKGKGKKERDEKKKRE